MIRTCKICGKYSDIFEYPEEDRSNYRPNLCYQCYLEQKEAEEEEEQQPDDPNAGYCVPAPEIDPEEDDTPDIDNDENTEESEVENDAESDITSDEEQSIKNIRELLFG